MSYEQLLHAYNAACAENQALRAACDPDFFHAYNAACAENQALRATCDALQLRYDQALQQGNSEWCAAKTAAQAVDAELVLTQAKLVLLEKENEEKLEHIQNLNERLTQQSLELFVNVNGLRREIAALKTAASRAKHESKLEITNLQQQLQQSFHELFDAKQLKDKQKPRQNLSDDHSYALLHDHPDDTSDDTSDNTSDDLSHDDNDLCTAQNKFALCMYVVGYENWHVSDEIQNTFSSVHEFVMMLIALWKAYFQ